MAVLSGIAVTTPLMARWPCPATVVTVAVPTLVEASWSNAPVGRNVAKVEGPGQAGRIFDHHTLAVSRGEPGESQGHDRAERMTSQNIHRPCHLGENVLSKVIDGQPLRARIMP